MSLRWSSWRAPRCPQVKTQPSHNTRPCRCHVVIRRLFFPLTCLIPNQKHIPVQSLHCAWAKGADTDCRMCFCDCGPRRVVSAPFSTSQTACLYRIAPWLLVSPNTPWSPCPVRLSVAPSMFFMTSPCAFLWLMAHHGLRVPRAVLSLMVQHAQACSS